METQNNRAAFDSTGRHRHPEIWKQNTRSTTTMSSASIRSRGKRSLGRRNLQALRGHHPGKPSGFVIRRIVGVNDLWVTEYVINYKTTVVQTVSIMEFQNGKVIHETQYFAEPFKALMALAMGRNKQIAHKIPLGISSRWEGLWNTTLPSSSGRDRQAHRFAVHWPRLDEKRPL